VSEDKPDSKKWKRSDKISLISAIISIVVLIVFVSQTLALREQTAYLGTQTSILNNQFTEKDRPWIGLETFSDEGNKITFGYTNYGAIPDDNGTMLLLYRHTPITKNDLESSGEGWSQIGSVIPNEHRAHFFTDLPIDFVQSAKLGTSSLYLGILIKYNYENDKQGEFGTLVNYTAGTFLNLDNWAK